jgi:hypothetical protein
MSDTARLQLIREAIRNAGSPRCRERAHYTEGVMFADMSDACERVLGFDAEENQLLARLCAKSLRWQERLESELHSLSVEPMAAE